MVQRFQVLRLFWDLKNALGSKKMLDIVYIVDICEAIWITLYKSLLIPRLSNLKNVNYLINLNHGSKRC